MDFINRKKLVLFFALLTLTTACENPLKKAARNATYSAYEMVGIEKRDLLKRRVETARKDQKEAGKDFEDALTRLKAVYGFKGGELENKYDELNKSYDRANYRAEAVHESVQKVETVARDLFNEWEKEIDEIETASLKAKSREQLASTQKRYSEMHANLKASESKMDPILHKLKDHVLFLKHNLNAQAIASLKGEALNIQKEIESLIQDMNKSIDSADRFIKTME
jgi:hypothetical protein